MTSQSFEPGEDQRVQLVDTFGRTINYLRLSVTDRCNLRCHYCMPDKGVEKLAHGDILSYEELLLIARTAVQLGVEKVRVTGGEPLVRRGITSFLARLAGLPGLRHLVLTTNGLLLAELAADLRHAGVQRVNVSLDSLDPATFAAITRGGDLARVLAGLAAADSAGLPLKLNMVVMRGVNDAEIEAFARLTLESPFAVRFIEYMPTLQDSGWQEQIVPGSEILERLAKRFRFALVDRGPYAGPSQDFRIEGARGTFGIITPVSGHFCSDCNRIRVTAAGEARSCLFSAAGIDLKPFLRPEDGEGLREALRRLVEEKPHRHGMNRCGCEHEPFVMAKIGG